MKLRILFTLLLLPIDLFTAPLDRKIIAFWDSLVDNVVEDSLVHRTVEMPLNHLGLDIEYYDVQKPLPALAKNDGVRGVLICFSENVKVQDPEKFINWAVNAIDMGKKVVLMRNTGFLANLQGEYTSEDTQNRLYEKLGISNSQEWVDYTYDYQIAASSNELIPFEKKFNHPLPGFYRTRVFDSSAKSYLKIAIPGKPETEVDLVVLSPQGGYIAEYYANTFDPIQFSTNSRLLGWYVNPFRFLELAFETTNLPIPDTTTLAGRRIFFATCHGDNWNNETSMEEYQGKEIYNAEVILEKVIKPHPDIPIAVGLVAADFDPKWAAKKRSQETAKKYFETPQVEAATHTYSHPFFWEFFRTGADEKERDYLSFYPYGSWENSFQSWFRARMYQLYSPKEFAKRLKWGYFLPRAYANEKFNLEKEIGGSVDYLNQFAPKNNQIKLMIWPGDSRPWDQPVRLCETAGLENFGGGFVQFDAEHPSVLFVYPLARKPGGWIQLYAAANAENAYTQGWKDNFYRFSLLPETLKNLESPRRLKPILLYYHSYSGEFDASVNAILSNIKFIKSQAPIAIQVKRYCSIGKGFFSAVIDKLTDRSWKILNRQGLQTIRFDHPNGKSVDFSTSNGVIGYKNYQNSLYVYLDAAVEEPLIALGDLQDGKTSYLEESSWEIWDLKRNQETLEFKTKGWGPLFMQWKMPRAGTYTMQAASNQQTLETSPDGILKIELNLPYNNTTLITLTTK